MAKLAVILPHENLRDTMRMLLRMMRMDQAVILQYSGDYNEIPALVSQAKHQGIDIILTRGLVAERVRQCSDLPVVDIRVTAQELGVMIQQAKVLTMKTPPTIAIVGTASMFCDYCRLSELLHVTLTSYLIAPDDPDPSTSLAKQTELAVRDHVDAIIGGTIACSVAQAHSVPSIFLSSTLDSLQEGLRNAKRMAYAIDQEKNNAAEVQTMLDSSFSILIRFSREGYITTVNKAATARLGQKAEDIYDRPLLSLVSGISHQQLQRVVLTGSSLNSVFITIGADRFVANLVPVRISDGSIVGGVLSCDEVDRIETVSADIRREQRRLRHPAIHDFQTWPCRSPQMKQLREEAERFALSDAPILLRYEPGCYPQVLAEAIHNASERREMPFVSMDCAETSPQEQLERLFGYGESGYDVARSLCALAHTGTLYLQKPEFLCPQAQNRLRRLLTQNVLENTASASPYPLDLRLIAATEATAEEWSVLDGFDRELRFLMSGLVLRFPALREMPEEIEYSYPLYLNRYLKKYQRYLSVTKGRATTGSCASPGRGTIPSWTASASGWSSPPPAQHRRAAAGRPDAGGLPRPGGPSRSRRLSQRGGPAHRPGSGQKPGPPPGDRPGLGHQREHPVAKDQKISHRGIKSARSPIRERAVSMLLEFLRAPVRTPARRSPPLPGR